MNKMHSKKHLVAVLVVLAYVVITTGISNCFPLTTLQDLTNPNMNRRTLHDIIETMAVLPFVVAYIRNTDFKKAESFRWIPWGIIGGCTVLVAIILPEKLYAFFFYFVIVGCGEEFVFRGYLHTELRKTFSFKTSVILGGLLFGFAHGYSYYIIRGGSITDILSELGGGIIGALIFSTIYEKSESIGWSILIHTCLDFAGYLI